MSEFIDFPDITLSSYRIITSIHQLVSEIRTELHNNNVHPSKWFPLFFYKHTYFHVIHLANNKIGISVFRTVIRVECTISNSSNSPVYWRHVKTSLLQILDHLIIQSIHLS